MTHFALDPDMTDADWEAAAALARQTRAGAFGPVNACCGVTASVGHDLHCDKGR